ncbi:MFS family permease [Caulobacter ginsengisoli]|uniref:MFS family permease n=1 Tax=Caulobacter ginsengisoli TaxID=400775 RepID=A0ABU0J0E6_9CAUL|nr:MFS transporter [Caulobacter ginsengisoli]MDQ0466903.1 MFS family permease [Caulobacter ginsengisoli]
MKTTATGLNTTTRQAAIALAVLFVVALFNYIDRSIVSILQEPIKKDLGLSDAQLGAITGLSFALFYTTLALPIARLADRTVRKRLIAVAFATWSLMTALSGLATSFLMLVGFRVGVALGEAGCVPASHSLISDYFPQRRRATAIAIWGLSLPLGTMLGFASGGWLAAHFDWRQAFLTVGLAGVALSGFVLLLREPKRGQFDTGLAASDEPMPLKAVIGKLWSLRSFRWLALGGALHAYAQHTMVNWNAPFYARVHHLTIGEIALALALLFGVGGGLGQFVGGLLVDRAGRHDRRWYMWLPALASLLLVPAALAQYFVADPKVSLLIGVIPAILLNVYLAPIVATAQTLVPSRMRAFTSATLVMIVNILGLGLGPVVTGAISDLLSQQYGLGPDALRYAISTCLVASLAASWAFYRSAAHLPAEMSAADEAQAVPALNPAAEPA